MGTKNRGFWRKALDWFSIQDWSRQRRDRTVIAIIFAFLLLCTGMCYYSKANGPNQTAIWSGILGYYSLTLLVFTVLCGVRFPLLESFVGLDSLWWFHRWSAVWCFVFMWLHIAMKLIDYIVNIAPMTADAMFRWVFLFDEGTVINKIAQGRVAMYAMILLTLLPLVRRLPGRKTCNFVPWAVWMTVHFTAYPMLGFVFAHVFQQALCAAMLGPQPDYTCWLDPNNKSIVFMVLTSLLAAPALLALLWRLLRTSILLWGGALSVTEVRAVSSTLTEVTLAHPSGQLPNRLTSHSRQAGHFGVVRVPVCGKAWPFSSPHPLTFVDAPNEHEIKFLVRALPYGSFSRTVKDWHVGTRVYVEGPYGLFTPSLAQPRQPILFVVGGCGFTPLLSCMRQLAEWSETNKSQLNLTRASEIAVALPPSPPPSPPHSSSQTAVAPLMHATLRQQSRQDMHITLIIAVRTHNDVFFIHEMSRWLRVVPNLYKIWLIFSDKDAAINFKKTCDPELQATFDVRQGRVNEEVLQEYFLEDGHAIGPERKGLGWHGDENKQKMPKTKVYLCGPQPMRRAVKKMLTKKFRVPVGNIVTENFLM